MYTEYFEELNKLDEDYLFEMANATKEDTGLPYDIQLDSVGKNRKNTHNSPRIKVKVGEDYIPILICDNPKIPDSAIKNGAREFKDFNVIKQFIIDNKGILLKHWNKELNDREILNLLYQNKANIIIPGQLPLFNDKEQSK